MIRSPLPSSLVLVLALTACGGDKGQSTTDLTTGTTGDPLGGSTTSGALATVPTTDVTDDPPSPATSASTEVITLTSVSETDAVTTSATTGEPKCQFDIPPPGPCDGGKPKPAAPRFVAPVAAHIPGRDVIADAPDPAFASTSGGFIIEPDVGSSIECDLFSDDCGPAQKCNAWADDGGVWNATKCVPVADDPDPIGAPCTTDGSNVGGIDSCVKGAMCWNVDNDNTGRCVEQCGCSLDNPTCTTPDTLCLIANDDVLALCLAVCDPLDVDSCKPGELCMPDGGGGPHLCALDASGDAGNIGDPCQFLNACKPGLLCGTNSGLCADAGCCTPYCDLDAPTCPDGLACLPFFEQPDVPQCFEDLGVCVQP